MATQRAAWVLATTSIGLLATAILLACWESAGHIDVLAGPINGWTGGIGLLIASETLGASLLLFNAVTLPRWKARVVLPRLGIVWFLVAGATLIIGYLGNVATYSTVTTLDPGNYVPYSMGNRACHGRVVVAREANPLWRSRGGLYRQRGILLFEDTRATYKSSFGSKPVAEGAYTASCGPNGVTVHFTQASEEPTVPPVTLTFTR